MIHLKVWVLLEGTVALRGALEPPYLTWISLLTCATPCMHVNSSCINTVYYFGSQVSLELAIS